MFSLQTGIAYRGWFKYATTLAINLVSLSENLGIKNSYCRYDINKRRLSNCFMP